MIKVFYVSTFAAMNESGNIVATDGFISVHSDVLGTYVSEQEAYHAVKCGIENSIDKHNPIDWICETDYETFVAFEDGPLDESGGHVLDKTEYFYTYVEEVK